MATTEELHAALSKAHAAGNTEDAKRLVTAISQAQEEGDGFSAAEMIKNIPSSAGKLIKDVTHPIRHPIQTAESLVGLGMDAGSKMDSQPNTLDLAKYVLGVKGSPVDSVVDATRQRYGSVDAVKSTLQNDPVGLLADASGLVTAGATTALKTGKVAKMAQKAGMASDPINIASNIPKLGANNLTPKALPRKLYESAAKFRPSLDKTIRTNMVETALKEGIMPTTKGLDKAKAAIGGLDSDLNKIIEAATATGKTIPKGALYTKLKDLRVELGGMNLDAVKELKQVDNVVKGFEDHLKKLNKDSLTPRELQSLKTRTYKTINFDIKQGKASYAKNETRKAVAKSAKELLEDMDPSIKNTNKRMGNLIELSDELPRVASRIDNHNIIGIDAPLKVAGGQALGGDIGGQMGALSAILGMPKLKARTALMMEAARNPGIQAMLNNNSTPLMLRQGLLQSGRQSQQGLLD